jgi:hypothetical protein
MRTIEVKEHIVHLFLSCSMHLESFHRNPEMRILSPTHLFSGVAKMRKDVPRTAKA